MNINSCTNKKLIIRALINRALINSVTNNLCTNQQFMGKTVKCL